MYILGAAAILAGAYQVAKKKSLRELKKKYHFQEEIPDKDLTVLPKIICNPIGFGLLNYLSARGNGTYEREVKRTTFQIESFDKKKITIYMYEPENCENEVLPCLVYYHGGAFYVDYMDAYHEIMGNYAKMAKCRVVAVRYRPMTKGTFRTSLKDCYQGLLYTYQNAENLRIDKEHIAVGGDSAGGTFAAAVTHCIRELGGPKVCYQMLLYPAVDIAMSSESMKKYTDTPGWNSTCQKSIFRYIVPSLDEEIRPYFNLIEQENYDDLCNAYIEVEEYDCLHDDGEKYAQILMENGYTVDFNEVKGTFHAFDQNQQLTLVKEVMRMRCEFLMKAFCSEQEGGSSL